MKCKVCGFDENEKQELKSWERKLHFINIKGYFTAYNHTYEIVEVELYACPKCGVVILNNLDHIS